VQCGHKRSLADLGIDLGKGGTPVLLGQQAEAAVRRRFPELFQAEIPSTVALAREREDRVRAGPNLTRQLLREVRTEERQLRVRNRVDERANELARSADDRVIPPAEWNDLGRNWCARHPREAVGVQTGTGDEVTRAEPACGRRDDGIAMVAVDGGDLSGHTQLPAHRRNVLGKRPRHLAEVDDPGTRCVERADPDDVRFELGETLRPNHLHPLDPVRDGSSVELLQGRQLVLLSSDDYLAAPLVADASLVTVGIEEARPFDAQLRLQRARRVVDTGVDNAAVVAALVDADLILFLEYGNCELRPLKEQLPSNRKPENAGTDDDGIELRVAITGRVRWFRLVDSDKPGQ